MMGDIILNDNCECGHNMKKHNFISSETMLFHYGHCTIRYCDCNGYVQYTEKPKDSEEVAENETYKQWKFKRSNDSQPYICAICFKEKEFVHFVCGECFKPESTKRHFLDLNYEELQLYMKGDISILEKPKDSKIQICPVCKTDYKKCEHILTASGKEIFINKFEKKAILCRKCKSKNLKLDCSKESDLVGYKCLDCGWIGLDSIEKSKESKQYCSKCGCISVMTSSAGSTCYMCGHPRELVTVKPNDSDERCECEIYGWSEQLNQKDDEIDCLKSELAGLKEKVLEFIEELVIELKEILERKT